MESAHPAAETAKTALEPSTETTLETTAKTTAKTATKTATKTAHAIAETTRAPAETASQATAKTATKTARCPEKPPPPKPPPLKLPPPPNPIPPLPADWSMRLRQLDRLLLIRIGRTEHWRDGRTKRRVLSARASGIDSANTSAANPAPYPKRTSEMRAKTYMVHSYLCGAKIPGRPLRAERTRPLPQGSSSLSDPAKNPYTDFGTENTEEVGIPFLSFFRDVRGDLLFGGLPLDFGTGRNAPVDSERERML